MSQTVNTVKKSKIESIISKTNDKIIYKLKLLFPLDQSFCNISLYYSLPSLYELSDYLFSLLKSYFKSQLIILKEEIFILQDSLDYLIKSFDSHPSSLSSLSSLLSINLIFLPLLNIPLLIYLQIHKYPVFITHIVHHLTTVISLGNLL